MLRLNPDYQDIGEGRTRPTVLFNTVVQDRIIPEVHFVIFLSAFGTGYDSQLLSSFAAGNDVIDLAIL